MVQDFPVTQTFEFLDCMHLRKNIPQDASFQGKYISPPVKNYSRAVISRLPISIAHDLVVGLRSSALGVDGGVSIMGVGTLKKRGVDDVAGTNHLCIDVINIISGQGSWEGGGWLCGVVV
jgi:hypothetical protein